MTMAKTKGRTTLHKLTDEQRDGLRTFQQAYGDRWQEVMDEYHRGIVRDSRGKDVAHLIRQIRNHVTPNPAELPDLREKPKITIHEDGTLSSSAPFSVDYETLCKVVNGVRTRRGVSK